jgi:hypothetical protein
MLRDNKTISSKTVATAELNALDNFISTNQNLICTYVRLHWYALVPFGTVLNN